jgi:hypothetical protein
MGNGYETRLIAFAEGKRLARLSRVVKDRGICDACGSTLPRFLFGLRETVSGRHYFLGQNCLAWLLERRLVARARYRESAEVAYRREMELRGQGSPAVVPAITAAKPAARQVQPARSSNGAAHVQSKKTAQVNGLPTNGFLQGLVTAPEPRSRFRWVREGSALVLHRLVEPSDTDLEAFFRAAYLLARDHLLAEGHRSVPVEGERLR